MSFLIRKFVRLVALIVWVLPRPVQLLLGDILGFLWFDLFRIRRRVVLENLKIAFPNWTESQRVKVGRESLHGMGRTLIEYLLMIPMTPEKSLSFVEIQGREIFDRALKQGKGVLLLTCHLGNGDFATMVLSHLGYPMKLISKQMKAQWLNDAWFGLRRRHGTEFIREEKSSFEILRSLKANAAVIFVLDQYMGPPSGVKTRFFGKETGTAQGLALFHHRTQSPVIPCYTYRRADGKTMMIFEEAIPLEEKPTVDETISFMTQKYTDKIEEIVKRHPGQWMWLHRRWKPFR